MSMFYERNTDHERAKTRADRQAMTHHDYECPTCGEWIEVFPTTPEILSCPWCKEPLLLAKDGEYRDGLWRDLTRLVSNRPHIERMIAHKTKQDYSPAPDELRDAYINDCDAGSCEGEE